MTESTTKRKVGHHVANDLRDRGLKMLREGASGPDVQRALGVSSATTSRWRTRLSKQPKQPKQPKKAKPTSATSYLAKQLEIIARMIQTKLPELAKFSLSVTADGDAGIEYAVRQTTLVSGTVKL